VTGLVEDKAGLVTGAASGIGRASAIALAREGASVVVFDLEACREAGEETVAMIEAAGGRARFYAGDVRSASDQEAVVRAVLDAYGALDFAHNNAGVVLHALLVDTTEEQWDRVIDTNLKGIWLGLRAQLPVMTARGAGSVVNTASLAGLIAAPLGGCYIASKHGVIGLTKTAAIESAPRNVRVNCVCPAAIDSPMNRDLSPEERRAFISSQALKRYGQPEEVAEAVVWLCSDRSSFVTGASLSVDAGTTAGIVLPGGEE
jgi:NAD(P)-dependent dehydrogenase (short-subunit alcohol dehydrogenase family)